MSQHQNHPHMSFRPFLLQFFRLPTFFSVCAAFAISGCSTPGQQLADKEILAVNADSKQAPAPYVGSYGPNQPLRLVEGSGYDQFNPGLSESVAVPFLSFLIIEPDPVTKNGIPSDISKLVKAKQYTQAISAIDSQLQKTPGNVQLRYVKARIYIQLRQWADAKKTLLEITQQFPELPEPYNNLAAMAANEGKWIEARDYLELALKLRPTYAIASANLGEVYLHLGAGAYENAAKDTQINKRLYSNRAKALLNIINPPQQAPRSEVKQTQ